MDRKVLTEKIAFPALKLLGFFSFFECLESAIANSYAIGSLVNAHLKSLSLLRVRIFIGPIPICVPTFT